MEIKKVCIFSPKHKEIIKMYKETFPSVERVGYWFLLLTAINNKGEFLGLYNNDKLIGFSYIVKRDEYYYLYYLCIKKEYRNKGYGSEALRYILKNKKTFFLDVEEPLSESQNYKQRVKRIDFYNKVGIKKTKYKYECLGEKYLILSNNSNICIKEILSIYEIIFKKGHIPEIIFNYSDSKNRMNN